MSIKRILNSCASIAFVILLRFVTAGSNAQQSVRARGDSLEGVVTGPNGPELAPSA
ncbi:MAG: hypothetical protein HYY23_15305 [Verrucomicrobia bacterium]|nr:hypothetical protein [Verrucomicrobiota bacterium]